MLNSSKSNLLSLKGKDWSSLQNLDSEDSEEANSEINYHQNGFLNLNRMSLVNGSEYTSDDSSLPLQHQDTTKLNKEDMCIYGLRPAYDEFYLVVCEHCGKVFKPQALSRHIELRHSNNEIHSDPLDRQVRSEESSSLTEDDFNSNRNLSDNNHNLRSLLATSSSLLASNSTKDDLDLEKLKHRQQSLLCSKSNSSSHSNTASPLNLPPSEGNSLVIKKLPTKHKLLPLKDRKYDADKHCGVQVSPNLSPCTRSLTCKTHSLTLRRSVPGRRDSFDNLLNEHRLAKEAALRAAGVEVKPTKLQLRQQQRMQKNNLLKEQQQQKETLKEQTNSNSSSLSNPPNNATTAQFKLHLQPLNSPSSLATSPSFKAFNQLHQQQDSTSIFNNINNKPNSTAPQSPTTNSLVNINKLQFTSPSPTVKQFANNQQLGKLLSSPSRPIPPFGSSPSTNNSQTTVLTPSIQVINQTNLMNSNHVTNFESNTNKTYLSPSSIDKRPFICDLSPATIGHYPKPAAVCTFNERRLSIFTQSSNKQILSSKLFNRKQDYTYSALSVFCNKEKMLNDTSEPNEQINQMPVKQSKTKQYKSNSILSNSQSNSRTDFYSSNSNSQESFSQQHHSTTCSSPFDRTNGLLSPAIVGRKPSVDLGNDHSVGKSYLYGHNKSSSILNDKDSDKFNSVNSTSMNF